MKYDYLIIGAGLFGATFARLATDKGKKCLVIDKRPHVGGNVYCENIEGINVHKYGAHIFHTSDKEVWDFVNSFVSFNKYVHCPIAISGDGKAYNLPFNMNTFSQLWGVKTPVEAALKIKEQLIGTLECEPNNLEDKALSIVGKDIYEILIKGYTEKQWGRKCKDLPPFIIQRLPVRFIYDNNYFNDAYQGIPIGGYNKLIESMLQGVDVIVDRDFFENRKHWESVAGKIVYTGKIDEFYDYQFGNLEYRTVKFETEIVEASNYQGCAVVNYTSSEIPYTRIIEHKHFEAFGYDVYSNKNTVISKEYSMEWKNGLEPFYPINNDKNQVLYTKYKQLADNEKKVIFGGRLAEYKYYDMDKVIRRALDIFKTIEK